MLELKRFGIEDFAAWFKRFGIGVFVFWVENDVLHGQKAKQKVHGSAYNKPVYLQ